VKPPKGQAGKIKKKAIKVPFTNDIGKNTRIFN
jgi:hypothetical protein